MNNNEGSFSCALCDEFHSESNFPINKALMEIPEKQPSEVSRSRTVEFKRKEMGYSNKSMNMRRNVF